MAFSGTMRIRLDARGQKGFSMTELLISLAITSVIVLVLGNLLMHSTRVTIDVDQRSRTDGDLRYAMSKVESTLLNATEFQVARTTEIIFIADRITDPNYSAYTDQDGDGIINLYDPDDENDATLIQPSSAQWRFNYDMKDDDDDNDNQVDMRWRIRFATASKILYMDYSRDNEAWGIHEETVLTNVVSTPIFSFFGSPNNDVVLSTITDSNGDGIISQWDIDAVVNNGNGNFTIEGSTELARIVTIGVYLDKDDEDSDRTVDSHLSIEVMPPGLYLKRRP